MKVNTLKRQLNPIQNMFKVAYKEWGLPIPINPVAALRFRNEDDARERRIEEEEWTALLEAVEVARNPLIEPLMRLGRETGMMRRSEMLRITREHVGLKRRELFVPPARTIRPALSSLVRPQLRSSPRGWRRPARTDCCFH